MSALPAVPSSHPLLSRVNQHLPCPAMYIYIKCTSMPGHTHRTMLSHNSLSRVLLLASFLSTSSWNDYPVGLTTISASATRQQLCCWLTGLAWVMHKATQTPCPLAKYQSDLLCLKAYQKVLRFTTGPCWNTIKCVNILSLNLLCTPWRQRPSFFKQIFWGKSHVCLLYAENCHLPECVCVFLPS